MRAPPTPSRNPLNTSRSATSTALVTSTETCLRIGGYVRYDIGAGESGSTNGVETFDRLDGGRQQTWRKNARADIKIFTGSETELGTLKTYSEFEFNFGNSDDGTAFAHQKGSNLDSAWISLGGFLIGFTDSVYASWTGFAGNVIQDSIISYGDQDSTNQINYTFDAGNGFSAVISLEEGQGAYSKFVPTDNTIDSYVPHVVGGVKYTQGWGSISAVAAYNSSYEEWAGKIRLDVNASDQLSLFIMGGYGTDDNIDRNYYKAYGGNWAVWGGASYKLNERPRSTVSSPTMTMARPVHRLTSTTSSFPASTSFRKSTTTVRLPRMPA